MEAEEKKKVVGDKKKEEGASLGEDDKSHHLFHCVEAPDDCSKVPHKGP